MVKLGVGADAVKAQTLVDPPGVYLLEIMDIRLVEKDDGSTNRFFDLEIQDGEFKGVPFTMCFSTKADKFSGYISLLKALGLDVEADEDWESDELLGEQVKGYVAQGKFGDRSVNKCDQYYPEDYNPEEG